MSTAVEDALLLLADNYEQDGCYAHSIHCLQALVTTQELLPATEVKVRLHLARLLLDHTYDVDQAKTQLQTALVKAVGMPGNLCIRCELLSLLGKCSRLLGNDKDQSDCYEKGLDTCLQGASTIERDQLLRWQVYFQSRLAEVHLTRQDAVQALQWAYAGLQLATQCQLHQEQVLLLLCKFHLELIQPGGTAAASQTVRDLTTVLNQLPVDTETDSTFACQAKLNFNMMQALMHLREGQLQALSANSPQDSNKLNVIHTMETLLKQLQGKPPAYDWVPYPMQNAIIQLIAANIIKHTGKGKTALGHLQLGEKLVDAQLRELGVTSTTFGTQLPTPVMCRASMPLLLKMALLECKVQLHLLQTKLEDARKDLWRCIKLLTGYPFMKGHMGPALHVLLGMYAYSVGRFQEAALHCHAAVVGWERAGNKNSKAAATCLKVLSSVHAGDPNAVGIGLDVLGPGPDPDLSYMESTVCQLTRSVLKLQQGHAAEAKSLLSKSLKTAHHKLNSHHIISNVLNLLAPLQLRDNDVAGAEQMATSSYTLSRNNSDLPGLLNAFKVMHTTHKMLERGTEKLAEDQSYITKKTNELQAAMARALGNTEQHEAVLMWDLTIA